MNQDNKRRSANYANGASSTMKPDPDCCKKTGCHDGDGVSTHSKGRQPPRQKKGLDYHG